MLLTRRVTSSHRPRTPCDTKLVDALGRLIEVREDDKAHRFVQLRPQYRQESLSRRSGWDETVRREPRRLPLAWRAMFPERNDRIWSFKSERLRYIFGSGGNIFMTKFGFDEADWEAAKDEAREVLVEVARRRGRIPYSELVTHIHAISIDYSDPRLAYFLGEISEAEDAAGRGMLTAIVTHKHGDMQPGPGFFELAKRLGRDTTHILECWVGEFNRVHDYWANKTAV